MAHDGVTVLCVLYCSTKGAKRAKAGDKRRAMEAEVQVLDPSTPGTQ